MNCTIVWKNVKVYIAMFVIINSGVQLHDLWCNRGRNNAKLAALRWLLSSLEIVGT